MTTEARLTSLRMAANMVVGAITQHHVGAATVPAPLAPHRRHGLQEWDELGDVVAVAAGQGGGGNAFSTCARALPDGP